MKYFVYLVGILCLLGVVGCDHDHNHDRYHGGAYDGTYNGYGHDEHRPYPAPSYDNGYHHE